MKEEEGNVKCLSCDKNVQGVSQASFTQMKFVSQSGEQQEAGRDYGTGHHPRNNIHQQQNTQNTTYNNTSDLNYNTV